MCAGMKIAIASDHAAIDMKAALATWLRETGHEVTDLGADSKESVDYPDYGYALAEHVAAGKAERGVALCGTGIGISIAANRHPAIRCAVVTEPFSAQLARDHNDANVLALGERILGLEMAKACLKAFIETESGSGERHARRIGKLTNPPVEA
jgi:ribose 5-phosphate isomerase B